MDLLHGLTYGQNSHDKLSARHVHHVLDDVVRFRPENPRTTSSSTSRRLSRSRPRRSRSASQPGTIHPLCSNRSSGCCHQYRPANRRDLGGRLDTSGMCPLPNATKRSELPDWDCLRLRSFQRIALITSRGPRRRRPSADADGEQRGDQHGHQAHEHVAATSARQQLRQTGGSGPIRYRRAVSTRPTGCACTCRCWYREVSLWCEDLDRVRFGPCSCWLLAPWQV